MDLTNWMYDRMRDMGVNSRMIDRMREMNVHNLVNVRQKYGDSDATGDQYDRRKQCGGHGRLSDRCKSFSLGERGSGLRTRNDKIQDFYKLRSECLSSGVLFEDSEFPAVSSSVFGDKAPSFQIQWLRPSEICSNPKLFVEGASRFDVVQGSIGNCWMVASAANLTLNDELFNRVVPDDQSFTENYAGIFHFRIWKANRWLDVVVDDRLPTLNGQLLYMKSRSGNEFWSALLEKAYAKIHGSYEVLSGGSASEAMEDFTGGVTEQVDLKNPPDNLFTTMLKAYERSSLMSCAIQTANIPEEKLQSGLVAGHAYSITCIRLVNIQTARMQGRIPLIRIRNPWGDDTEWRGAWSDKSQEWSVVSEEERQQLGITFDADGEFWMSFKDFLANFEFLEICNLGPDALDAEVLTDTSKKKWEVSVFEGSWTKGITAGGCRNYLETFWMNPQYLIKLEDPDDDDEDDLCTIIVALMQKNRRAARTLGAGLFLTVGFAIYKIEDPENVSKPLGQDFFKYNASAGRSHTFINSREVTTRFRLPPGTYCIVPSTFEPNQTGDFLLRIFAEKKNVTSENDDQVEIVTPDAQVQAPQEDPDAGRNQQIREFFASLAGEDMEIDCYELQKILNFALKKDNEEEPQDGPYPAWVTYLVTTFKSCGLCPAGAFEFQFEQFSLDVSRSMVALMDTDRSGKLGLDEFRSLWMNIRTWKNVFKMYDKDNSGTLSTFELRLALNSAGYRVNSHVLKALVLRYGKGGHMSFDDFIGCVVKLKTMIETFKEKDSRHLGRAIFSMDEWLECTMYS